MSAAPGGSTSEHRGQLTRDNLRIVLRRRPHGMPAADDFAVERGLASPPADGQVLARTLMVSIDPAMRRWVSGLPGYVEPVALGAVMRSFGVAEVVDSRIDGLAPGDVVVGVTGWQEWATMVSGDIHRRVDPALAPVSAFLGVLGISGLTAYVGMFDICRPLRGETVVVSAAAGAVGSAAGQLARLRGARVVGLAGSAEKCRTCIDEFGFDACIDYRHTADLDAELGRWCPDGIDAYFDNVGGNILDAVLNRLAIGGRVAICGTLAVPEGARVEGPRAERVLLTKRALLQGFIATDHLDRGEPVAAELAGYLSDGRLRYREDIAPSLTDAPSALERLLAGRNRGKSLVRVATSPLENEWPATASAGARGAAPDDRFRSTMRG